MVRVQRTNTILYSGRWNAMVEYYRDVIGLNVAFENDWFVEFALGPDAFLSVADSKRSSVAPGDGAGLTLSLRVANLAAARAALLDAGADVGPIRSRWGSPTCDALDPDGNRLEFWSGAPLT